MLRGFGDSSLGQIHFRELGEGYPVVLLHPTAQSSDMWLEVMPMLAEKFRVIAPDTPGFGDSDHPTDPPDMEGYAKSLAELLESIGVTTSHVVGHHHGAAIGAEYASRYPDRVSKFVASGLPDYDEDQRPGKLANISKVSIEEDGSHLRWFWSRSVRGYGKWGTPEQKHRAVVDSLKAGPDYLFAYLALFSQRVRDRIPFITAPTLVMSGEQDIFNVRQAEVVRLFKNGTTATIAEAGELPMQQMPVEFANVVLRFLADRPDGPMSKSV